MKYKIKYDVRELKNCPMCGSKARIETSRDGTAFKISCTKVYDCGLTQYWFDETAEAITAWNKRIKEL